MTVAHPSSPVSAPDLAAAIANLRARGLRVSAARRLVLETLYAADRPLSAEQIADGVGALPQSDQASVYRNLETLEELGLIRHVHLGHGPGRYALAGLGEREYLTCERCGDFVAVEPGRLDEVRSAVRKGFGYEAHFTHFPIVGLCPACAGKRKRPARLAR